MLVLVGLHATRIFIAGSCITARRMATGARRPRAACEEPGAARLGGGEIAPPRPSCGHSPSSRLRELRRIHRAALRMEATLDRETLADGRSTRDVAGARTGASRRSRELVGGS